MRKDYYKPVLGGWVLTLSLLFFTALSLAGQGTIRGTVVDVETSEPLMGASIAVKGKLIGTVTEFDGTFQLTVNEAFPIELIISYTGYETKEMTVNDAGEDLRVELASGVLLTSQVVISASRVEERILESPVTIEKMDPIAIRQTAAPDFYDGISNLKGVQTTQGSLTLTSINTRGFGAVANERFVQLLDGVDNAAPLLNFPTGNIVGVSELDAHSVELVPGAASALYGPNAFNGILLMRSKNPFEYPGLSVQTKVGVTDSDAGGSNPYYQLSARYATRIGQRLAFKVNASYLEGTDWQANDYMTGRQTQANPNPAGFGAPNFDGLNTYGDETQILLPMAALTPSLAPALAPIVSAQSGGQIPVEMAEAILNGFIPTLGTLDIRRTGFREEDLLESMEAKSLKLDAALHYRLTDRLEASYSYRFGSGSTVYQGGERYVLRDFTQQFHKLELQSPSFFVRAYATVTGDGDSYNLSALGAFSNEYFKPSASEWVPTYAGAYVLNLLSLQKPNFTETDIANAHLFARSQADDGIPQPGDPAFQATVDQVRNNLFQRNPPGAGFVDQSRLYHVEFNKDLSEEIGIFDLQIGGNIRRYDLFSDGTVFNENPDGEGGNERITIDEFGAYAQVSKRLADERIKLTGSLRFDKNENFEGRFTPRLSAVYSAGSDREHNFRASFQTGFRNPSTQQQFIFFPLGDIYLIGSTEANAARYGVHQGGAYTNASYQAFLQSALAGQPNPGLLEETYIDYVKPERIQAFELGYKGLIERRLLIDFNFYYSIYNDFIAQRVVRPINGFTHQGNYLPGVNDILAGQATSSIGVRPYINAEEEISSYGVGLGLNYRLFKDYQAYGHYNWSDFNVDNPGPDFEAGFNMPEHKFLIGLSNRKLLNRKMGFDFSYRWQDAFFWENSFAHGNIPAYGVFNAQLSYILENVNTVVKVGATNLFGDDYRTNAGGPFIGRMYYISLTYDQFMQ